MLDYNDLQDTGAGEELKLADLGVVTALARKMWKLEVEVNAERFKLKEMESELRRLSEVDLPTALQEAGVESLTLANGYRLGITETLYASIPEKNKKECAEWLCDHDLPDLVGYALITTFSSYQGEEAANTAAALREQGLMVELRPGMNTTSVKAALRELMEKGEDVPLSLFGAYLLRRAVLSEPKKGK